MPQDPAGFEDLFSVAQTGTLDEEGLQKYVTTMVTEYDKLVIGEYFRQEGKAEGLAEGEAKGRVEGKAEEKASIAKKMLDLGLAIPIIQQATGLTEEEIRAL